MGQIRYEAEEPNTSSDSDTVGMSKYLIKRGNESQGLDIRTIGMEPCIAVGFLYNSTKSSNQSTTGRPSSQLQDSDQEIGNTTKCKSTEQVKIDYTLYALTHVTSQTVMAPTLKKIWDDFKNEADQEDKENLLNNTSFYVGGYIGCENNEELWDRCEKALKDMGIHYNHKKIDFKSPKSLNPRGLDAKIHKGGLDIYHKSTTPNPPNNSSAKESIDIDSDDTGLIGFLKKYSGQQDLNDNSIDALEILKNMKSDNKPVEELLKVWDEDKNTKVNFYNDVIKNVTANETVDDKKWVYDRLKYYKDAIENDQIEIGKPQQSATNQRKFKAMLKKDTTALKDARETFKNQAINERQNLLSNTIIHDAIMIVLEAWQWE